MFIHRNNVDHYAQGKPRTKKVEPTTTTLFVRVPSTNRSVVNPSLLSSSRRGHTEQPSTLDSSHRYSSTQHPNARPLIASCSNNSSDSEEILVEEIRPSFSSRHDARPCSEPHNFSNADAWPKEMGANGFQLSGASEPPAATTVRAPTLTHESLRTNATDNNNVKTAAAPPPSLTGTDAYGGVGGVSPLAPVSPGVSRLDFSRIAEIKLNADADHEGDDDAHAKVRSRQSVRRSLATEANRQLHSEGDGGCLTVQDVSAHAGGEESSVARGGPSTSENRESSRAVSVSQLGRTLTAATRALAAAAEREALRRNELDAHDLRSTSPPSVPVSSVDDTLLNLALAEKVMLFDAYFSCSVQLREALELCLLYSRRDAQRVSTESAHQVKEQERALQQKVSLYRQHIASETARAAAAKEHAEEMRAAEAQMAELKTTVQQLSDKITVQEAALQEQQSRFDAERRQRQAEAYESAMELRALQRAHEQATERWMTVQVLYTDLRSRHDALKRRRQRQGGQEVQRQTFIMDGKLVVSTLPESVEGGFLNGNDSHRRFNETENAPSDTALAMRSSEAAEENGVATKAAAEPTALEALLARTTSDSGTFTAASASNPQAQGATENATSPGYVPPQVFGGLSSPPDTPLLRRAVMSDVSADDAANRGSSLHSPDAKPASPHRSIGAVDVEADDDVVTAAATTLDGGLPQRQTSSFRPSRLNSVASTRRGSSPLTAPPHNDVLHGSSPTNEKEGEEGEDGAGKAFARDEATVAMRRDAEDCFQRLAAEAVQRELSRLLTFASPRERVPALPPLQTTATTTKSHLTRYLSSPRMPPPGSEEERKSEQRSVVTLSALQWLRVCETAQVSAQVNSQLVERLQKLCDSLTQRIRLLEEKDWNKTMAKQFIAADHAAALRRLTVKVGKLLHGDRPA